MVFLEQQHGGYMIPATSLPPIDPKELEAKVLECYAPMFYRNVTAAEAKRHVRLIGTWFINHILHDHDSSDHPEAYRDLLMSSNEQVHDILEKDKILSYMAVAGHGLIRFKKNNLRPPVFMSKDAIVCARKIHMFLAQSKIST